jgi:riboflavin kinase/FMN adenylyltransferase
MLAGSPAIHPTALCLGVFDGVHRGHSAIIHAARRFIAGIPSGRVLSLTFDPHPSRVIRPESAQALLQPLKSRVGLLRDAGCDEVIVLPFTEDLAKQSPEAFWSILKGAVPGRILGIFAGQNWRFGVGRSGNLAHLASLSSTEGSVVIGVPPVMHQGKVISSSWIRELVRDAAFREIPPLLGRALELSGTVVTGQQLARQWGVPTANLQPEQECLPPNGVYAGWTRIEGKPPLWSVCNLGTRPSLTAEETRPLLEAHLFNFSENLYGQTLHFVPVHRIREERRFASLDALRDQIALDVEHAQQSLTTLDASPVGNWSGTP